MVGIESRVWEVYSHLKIGLPDVRVIGICGTGGIGKTTIARVVYDSFSNQFEASSFLYNVRETCERQGLVYLQKKLLSDISMERNIRFESEAKGFQLIKHSQFNKKVFFVFDDVDDWFQLRNLVGESRWYGAGSRIIIATRDKQLLTRLKVDEIYSPAEMSNEEALRLFSLTCFGSERTPVDFKKLSNDFVSYAGGLPLAIKFLGSDLSCRKSVYEWMSTLDVFNRFPPRELSQVFQISYDGLADSEKEIFLHMACFFNGEDQKRIVDILNSLRLLPQIGLKVLMDKSLLNLSLDKNGLWMHPLVQDMGRDMVYRECPDFPSRRSRLWSFKVIDKVLSRNKVSNLVEIFNLNIDPFYY